MAPVGSSSIVAVVSVLALAACGGGGGAKKVDPAQDLATASAAVLSINDLPGYASSPHTASDETPSSIITDFDTCLKVSATILDQAPGEQRVFSPDFSKDQTAIAGNVEIDANTSDIDDGWDVLAKPGTEPCFEQFFREAVKVGITESQGIGFGPVAVDRFDPGIGDRSVGYNVKLTATGPGAAAVFFVDFIFVAHDRAAMELEFSSSGAPLDRGFETGLAQKVYDRVGDQAK